MESPMSWQSVLSVQRWNAEQASVVLEEFDRSGLSLAGFARLHGLCPQRIRRWRTLLWGPEERLVPREASGAFVELVAQPLPEAVESPRLSIRCPTGHIIELTGVDAARGLDLLLRTFGGV
jgi:hypothetical protein